MGEVEKLRRKSGILGVNSKKNMKKVDFDHWDPEILLVFREK